MDGFYASSSNQQDILDFLREVFRQTADEFVNETEPLHRFIIRGAIAFGPVIHGGQVSPSASNIFQSNVSYKDSILLGLPMVQAHTYEDQAPPFGLFVHESARSFAPPNAQPLHHLWWKWINPHNSDQLRDALLPHYQWCHARSGSLLYQPERIAVHEDLVRQYFAS